MVNLDDPNLSCKTIETNRLSKWPRIDQYSAFVVAIDKNKSLQKSTAVTAVTFVRTYFYKLLQIDFSVVPGYEPKNNPGINDRPVIEFINPWSAELICKQHRN